MAIIPNLKEIPDKKPVDAGEYDLRITKVKLTKSNNTGRYGCMLICEIDGEDAAETLFHTLWYGNFDDGAGHKYDADDQDKSNTMWRMVKDFMRALGLDPDQETDESDLIGLEFTADLAYNDGMGTDDDGKPVKLGNPRNEIVRIQ